MADPNLLGIQITDEGGKVRNLVLPVNYTATVANIQTFLDSHLDKLDNVVGGKITGVFVTLAMSLAGMENPKSAPLADHPVDTGGLLGFIATGTKYRSSIFVPTYLNSLIDANKSIANSGDTATFISSVLGGESVITLTDLGGRALESFLSGKRKHRK